MTEVGRTPKKILKFCGRQLVNASKYVWDNFVYKYTEYRPVAGLGSLIYKHYAKKRYRVQSHVTVFMRNRTMYEVLAAEISGWPSSKEVRVASVGCSTGAELYSLLYILRTAHPDLKFVAHGMDLSEAVVDVARRGEYRCGKPAADDGLFIIDPDDPEFDAEDLDDLTGILEPVKGERYKVRSFLQQGVTWLAGDAMDPQLVHRLGTNNIVLANNFLGPMTDSDAERTIRNILTLVEPNGLIVLDGVDLDLKEKIVESIGLIPVTNRLREVYTTDPTKSGWPWVRWAHEPINENHPSFDCRYALIFRKPNPV